MFRMVRCRCVCTCTVLSVGSLPGPMLRDRSVVAFGKSIRQPGIASHEDQELLWHLPDEDMPAGGSAATMERPSESAVAAASRQSMSTSARLVSAASVNSAVTQAASEAVSVGGTPRGALGPPRDEGEEEKRRVAKLTPMPPPRLLGGAARNRGQVVLGGIGIGVGGSARTQQAAKVVVAPSMPTAAQRLSARANFQGRPVSLSRAGHGKKTILLSHLYIKMIILPRQARDKHRENSKKDCFLIGFEMKDPVPVLMDPAGGGGGSGSGGGRRGSSRGGTPRSGRGRNLGTPNSTSTRQEGKRMGVSARGPHSVRAQSRASTAVTSSAG
jgi:hypothetical protein